MAVPERQCLGCRAKKTKRELVRVVRSPSGGVTLDESGKLPGRGAYICPDAACLRRVVKSRALQRQLKAEIPPELLAELEARLGDAGDG
jgi:predicted RNA-binding protein YlxR (DUF448 family)